MVLSFLVPPIRRALFGSTAEEQIFERARNAFFFGAIVLFCLAFSVGVLHRTRRAIRRWTFLQSLILIVCFLISILPQLLDHYLNATVFLQILCMLGMYLILENNTDLFDAGSGFRTRTALWQESGVLFARHMPAAMVCVKLRDSGYLSMVLGAPTVNQLSREIGIYLQQFAGDDVHVCRLSERSYVLLFLPGKKTDPETSAEQAADQILARFQREWVLSDTPVLVGAQVWIGSIPEQLPDEQHVSVFADACFDPSIPGNALHRFNMLSGEQRRSEVELALQRALTGDTLTVAYQPILDTRDGKIHSCEALLRMHDPRLGDVSPEEFIKAAEQIASSAGSGTWSLTGSVPS